ncbi:pentapeptide repeat-containing protein [Rhodococcus koreensis]|uniref:pentapeptide repeat-containing protein n=1 Tax=Rhodococcus koreensis TaxID=99653 RepID=UPI00367146FA
MVDRSEGDAGAEQAPTEEHSHRVGLLVALGGSLTIVSIVLIILSFVLFLGPSEISQPQATVLGGAGVLAAGLITFLASHFTRISTERTAKAALDQTKAEVIADQEKLESQLDAQRTQFAANLAEQARSRELTHQREVTRDLRARYTIAAEQLGHNSAAIRLAGVYALASLADDWHRQNDAAEKQVAIDLLRAYVRTRHDPLPQDGFSASARPPEYDAGELEVRKTILLTMHKRTQLQLEHPKSWQDVDCGLADADLTQLKLNRANLIGANLAETRLIGAELIGAKLRGATLTLSDLTGAKLLNADLAGADLSFTKMSGARLVAANLAGADLGAADLTGANLMGADLSGATLTPSDLTDADLRGAKHNSSTRWPDGFQPPK